MNSRAITRPIAVTGMAGMFLGADNVGRFRRNLLSGVESIIHGSMVDHNGKMRFVPSTGYLEGIEDSDADYLRIPSGEVVLIDPQHRVLPEVAASAMQDAGYDAVGGQRVGAYTGCGQNYCLRDFVEAREAADGRESQSGLPMTGGTDTRILYANEKGFVRARIGFKLRFRGPSTAVQATYASGLAPVAQAFPGADPLAGAIGLIKTAPTSRGTRAADA